VQSMLPMSLWTQPELLVIRCTGFQKFIGGDWRRHCIGEVREFASSVASRPRRTMTQAGMDFRAEGNAGRRRVELTPVARISENVRNDAHGDYDHGCFQFRPGGVIHRRDEPSFRRQSILCLLEEAWIVSSCDRRWKTHSVTAEQGQALSRRR